MDKWRNKKPIQTEPNRSDANQTKLSKTQAQSIDNWECLEHWKKRRSAKSGASDFFFSIKIEKKQCFVAVFVSHTDRPTHV